MAESGFGVAVLDRGLEGAVWGGWVTPAVGGLGWLGGKMKRGGENEGGRN